VIKHALIPYFDNYISGFTLDINNYKSIIDNFISLNSVFEAFDYILKNQETYKAHEIFDRQFRSYMHPDETDKINSKEREKRIETSREKLARNDIKPFLEEFLPKLEIQKQQLIDYLTIENNSDNEIISLI